MTWSKSPEKEGTSLWQTGIGWEGLLQIFGFSVGLKSAASLLSSREKKSPGSRPGSGRFRWPPGKIASGRFAPGGCPCCCCSVVVSNGRLLSFAQNPFFTSRACLRCILLKLLGPRASARHPWFLLISLGVYFPDCDASALYRMEGLEVDTSSFGPLSSLILAPLSPFLPSNVSRRRRLP